MKRLQGILILFTLLMFMGCGGDATQINEREQSETRETNYKEKFINSKICNQIIDNEFIVMCYDYKLKASKSVAYTLDGDLMNDPNIDKRPSFYTEKSLDKKYRISTTDYTNSGYDRGHLAPDAAFDWSQESLEAVYTLANIIPQAPQVNRRSWAKLERYVRNRAEELGELSIVNVVKYGQRSSRMGKNRMAISKGYYKILYNKEENYEECFYYSNKQGISASNDILEDHSVSCAIVSN
jgi:endonuclease G